MYLYPATYRPGGPWQRPVAAPQGRQPFPPVYPFPTSGIAFIGGIVGVSQRLLLPRSARKGLPEQRERQRKSKKFRVAVWSPPSLLRRPLGSGLDLHLNLCVHLFSRLLLGSRGLVLGCLGSLGSLLPAWAGGGLPPPRKLAGLPLGGAGIGPRPMRAPAVGTLGCHMHAPGASSRPASLNGTLVVVCGVIFRANGAPGGL